MANTNAFLPGKDAVTYFNAYYRFGETETDQGQDWYQWVIDWFNEANTGEADNIMDLDIQMGGIIVDATTRGVAKKGFSSSVKVLNEATVTFDMLWLPQPADASFTKTIIDASNSFEPVGLLFVDKTMTPITTSTYKVRGIAGNWSVSMNKSEALKDLQKASISLTIVDYPWWFTHTVVG